MSRKRRRKKLARPANKVSPLDAYALRWGRWLPWLLAIGTALVFAQTVRFEFLHLDDASHVFQNPFIRSSAGDGILHLWHNVYRGLYIPATYTVWWLEGLVLGFDGGRFHAVNVLLHVINVVLVYDLIRRLLVSRNAPAAPWFAAAGAILFAVHPLRVEAVAWVTAMKDLLSATFGLLALRSYFDGKTPREGLAGHVPRGTVWFVLALLSKPSMIMLGPVALVLEVALLRVPWRASLRRIWPWFLLAVPFGVVTALVGARPMTDFEAPLWLRPFVAADSVYFYLVKILAPVDLAPVYGRTPEWLLDTRTWMWTWTLPMLLLGLAAWLAWRGRAAPLGLLVAFVLSLAPVLGFVTSPGYWFSVVADHYLYFPFLFVSIAVALALAELPAERHAVAVVGVVLVSGVLVVLTMDYVPTWRDDDTLFPYAIERSPDTALLRMNYGKSLSSRGRFAESLDEFNAAAEIQPHADVYNNIGAALANLGQYAQAKGAWEHALRLDPTSESARNNLAELERRMAP